MNKSIRLFSILLLAVFAMSCGSGSPPPKARDVSQGRAETKIVEGATAVGHNGSQMRKKIDKALDQNEARNKEIEKSAGSAPPK